MENITIRNYLYKCHMDGYFIKTSSYCDGIIDCFSATDEEYCIVI